MQGRLFVVWDLELRDWGLGRGASRHDWDLGRRVQGLGSRF